MQVIPGPVEIWNTQTCHKAVTLERSVVNMSYIFTPDSRFLVVSSGSMSVSDRQIKVWQF